MKKIFLMSVVLFFLGFFYILVIPKKVCSFQFQHNGFHIFSDERIDTLNLKILIDSVHESLFEINDVKIYDIPNIYICNNMITLKLLSFNFSDFFGLNQTTFNRIFIAKSAIDLNRVFINIKNSKGRKFTGVLSHELTHTFLYRKLGYYNFNYFFPTWKNEGFCDYIANETSFKKEEGIALIISNKIDKSNSFRYFTYFLRVKYLLDVKKIAFEDFLTNYHDTEKLDRDIKIWLLTNKNI